jgi:hypothetical protein
MRAIAPLIKGGVPEGMNMDMLWLLAGSPHLFAIIAVSTRECNKQRIATVYTTRGAFSMVEAACNNGVQRYHHTLAQPS